MDPKSISSGILLVAVLVTGVECRGQAGAAPPPQSPRPENTSEAVKLSGTAAMTAVGEASPVSRSEKLFQFPWKIRSCELVARKDLARLRTEYGVYSFSKDGVLARLGEAGGTRDPGGKPVKREEVGDKIILKITLWGRSSNHGIAIESQTFEGTRLRLAVLESWSEGPGLTVMVPHEYHYLIAFE